MAQTKKNIAETVAELIAPTVEAEGCTLWDVEYVKEGARQILRVTIDREDGVDIVHCEAVHRAIDPILDEADPIPVSYYLEVSSPGVERELRLPFHFRSFLGVEVEVRFFTAYEGMKSLRGALTAYDEENKTLTVSDKVLPLDKIAKVNVAFDFDNE